MRKHERAYFLRLFDRTAAHSDNKKGRNDPAFHQNRLRECGQNANESTLQYNTGFPLVSRGSVAGLPLVSRESADTTCWPLP